MLNEKIKYNIFLIMRIKHTVFVKIKNNLSYLCQIIIFGYNLNKSLANISPGNDSPINHLPNVSAAHFTWVEMLTG